MRLGEFIYNLFYLFYLFINNKKVHPPRVLNGESDEGSNVLMSESITVIASIPVKSAEAVGVSNRALSIVVKLPPRSSAISRDFRRAERDADIRRRAARVLLF